jgi:F-type H+-transporting ATPase subunit delta
MAGERTLARRYARALLDVAREQGADAINEVEQDLYGLADLWESSPELRTVIGHPKLTRDRKRAAVTAALEGKVQPLTIRFVSVLVEKGRLDVIRDIALEFDAASDEAQNVAKAKVATYLPLAEAQRAKLEERLRAFTARARVVIEETVDPSLLGGIVVRIGDQVLDGSVAGRLRKMRERVVLRDEERAQQATAAAAQALGT